MFMSLTQCCRLQYQPLRAGVGGATFDVDVEQRGRGPLAVEQEADAVRVVLLQWRQQQLGSLAAVAARRVDGQEGGAWQDRKWQQEVMTW